MTLQDIYYIVAITSTLVFIFIMLFIGFAIWQLYRTVAEFTDHTKKTLQEFKENTIDKANDFVNTPKSEIASMVGIGLGSFLLSRVKNIFKR